jgi:hypothetical protein
LDGALPKDQNLEDKQFSSESGINAVLNGLYTNLATVNLYGGKLTMTDLELMAHYYYYENVLLNHESYTYFYNMSEYLSEKDDVKGSFASVWKSAYTEIFRINNFIVNVEKSTLLSEDKKNLCLGEAYALRALVHFDLFRIFGDLNDIQKIPYNQSEEVIPHETQTASAFFTLLQQDILQAKTLLENDPVRTEGKILDLMETDATKQVTALEVFAKYLRNFRLNYYAVLALEARMLAYKGDIAAAAEIAQTVITESFGEVKEDEKPFYWVNTTTVAEEKVKDYIFYPEVMFGVYNLDLYTRWKTYTAGMSPGKVYAVGLNNLRNNIFKNDNTGSDISLWEDVRAKQWLPSSVGSGQYISCKFNEFELKKNDPKANMQPLIRMSELHYIIIENLIQQGRIPDAITYLNNFLMHRGWKAASLPDPLTMTADKANDLLETEYYKEFYGEGQVFFFLKRRGATKIINAYAPGMMEMDASNYIVPIPQIELNN